jgi:glycosyltransferase involved in cell wall biosynthesis
LIVFAALACLVCALIPAALFCVNLRVYRPPPSFGPEVLPAISVLIPARNEAHGIEAAVRSVLASTSVAFEVVVMDDASTDGTAEIVSKLSVEDARVRLERAPALPPGWNGKQHACWALANAAGNPVLCFMDADVRLEPLCLARMATFLAASDVSLVSGFPQQITGTWMEWMLLPLIHFILLGFLPLSRMRAGTDPAFAAGCGQFLMVKAEDYFACGGHPAIKETMHDGLRLPRLLREHGFRTDLADITGLARCRMYTSASQVWLGLAKNATEGLAEPKRILPVTLLLVLGQVVPFAVFGVVAFFFEVFKLFGFEPQITPSRAEVIAYGALLLAVLAAWLPRWLALARFRQDWRSALLHPVGIVLLLMIQWYALVRKVLGTPVSWKDRAYGKE